MKKRIIAFILLVLICGSSLISCDEFVDLHYTSFEEYKEVANDSRGEGGGFSHIELDLSSLWLPSIYFLDDYEYIDATYSLYEEAPSRDWFEMRNKPDISVLTLTFEKAEYEKAKEFMLDQIHPQGEEYYVYNDYYFYINHNYFNFFVPLEKYRGISHRFMMACYNDQKNILAFVGYYQGNPLSEEEVKSIEEDWASFVEEHFNPYYDFSK